MIRTFRNSSSPKEFKWAVAARAEGPSPSSSSSSSSPSYTSYPTTASAAAPTVDKPARVDGSIDHLVSARPCPPSTANWHVLKLKNIAWDLSIQDVALYIKPVPVSLDLCEPFYTQAIHIIMNRYTGKTLPICFVEFPSKRAAEEVLKTKARGILKGRVVLVESSSQRELMSFLFPFWDGARAIESFSETDLSIDNPMGVVRGLDSELSICAPPGVFLIREEINSILLICKSFKIHFSRKCPNRVFDSIVSILCKIPWQVSGSVSTPQRDHLFEMIKLAIEALLCHVSKFSSSNSSSAKNSNNLISNSRVLLRLVRAGVICPGFTDKQKGTLLKTSKLESFPDDLKQFTVTPEAVSEDVSGEHAFVMDDFVVGKNAEEEVGGDFDETFIPLIEGKEVFFGESSIPCAKIRNSEVIMSGSNLFTRVIKSLKQDGSKETTPFCVSTNSAFSKLTPAVEKTMETLYPSPPESDSLNANPFENPRTLPMIARGKAGESASDNGGNPFLFSATTATPPIYQQVKRFADGHRGASEGDVGDSDTHRQQQHVYGSKGVAVLHYQVIKSSLQQQQSQQQQQRRLNMNNVYPQQSENLVDVAGMFHSNSMSAINSWSGDGKHSRSLVSAPPQLPQQTVPAAMSTTSFVQQGRQQINASPTSPTASSYFGTPQPWSSPIDDSEVFRSPTLNRSIMNSNVKFTLQTLGISDEDSIPPARHVLASLSSSLNPSASATATQTSNDSSQSSSGIFPSDPHHFKEFTAGNGYFSSRNYINVSSYGVGGARSAVSDDRGMGGGIEKKVDGSSGDGGGLTVDSFLPFHQTYKGCQLLPPPQYASVGGGGGSGNTIYHPQQQHHHYQQQQYLSQYPQHLTHSEYRQPQGGRGRSGEHQHAFDRRGGFTQQIHGQPHHAPPYVAATGPSSDTQQMVNQQQRILELEALLMANKLL